MTLSISEGGPLSVSPSSVMYVIKGLHCLFVFFSSFFRSVPLFSVCMKSILQ